MHQPKKKKVEKPEKSEDATPLTTEEKAKEAMKDLLADAAKARIESLKLSSMPYASELSSKLLDHAKKLEQFYKDVQEKMGQKDEKGLKSLLGEIAEANVFTAQAQAGSSGIMGCVQGFRFSSIAFVLNSS